MDTEKRRVKERSEAGIEREKTERERNRERK